MRHPFLVSMILLAGSNSGWAAQFRAPVYQIRPSAFTGIAAAPALSFGTRISPSQTLSALPDLTPLPAASLTVPVIPSLPAVYAPAPVGVAAAPASFPSSLEAAVPSGLLEAAILSATPAKQGDEQVPALGSLFDGSVPILGGGLDSGAQTFSNSYGLYSWLSGLPEIAAAPDPESAKAGIVLALRGIVEHGPVIVMKDPAGLTAISANDPSVPPVMVSLSAKDLASPASPQAAVLAKRLSQAKARDESEPGRFYVAEVLAKLGSIADAQPEPEKTDPKLEPVSDVPLDPLRQPQEYLGRMLRDAARASEPEAALSILANARKESQRLLNSSARFRFLERLRSHGELLARQFVPGILEKMQASAGDHDRAGVEKLVDTAMEFVEYAPTWKPRVVQARESAMNTLAVLDQFGPIDPATGLPSQERAPEGGSALVSAAAKLADELRSRGIDADAGMHIEEDGTGFITVGFASFEDARLAEKVGVFSKDAEGFLVYAGSRVALHSIPTVSVEDAAARLESAFEGLGVKARVRPGLVRASKGVFINGLYVTVSGRDKTPAESADVYDAFAGKARFMGYPVEFAQE